MPLGLSAVVFGMIQSMETRSKMGEMTQPCLTTDSLMTSSLVLYCWSIFIEKDL